MITYSCSSPVLVEVVVTQLCWLKIAGSRVEIVEVHSQASTDTMVKAVIKE